jgi:hypothetical protein
MTITVELNRVGTSRVAIHAIPIEARVRQGGVLGANLLRGRGYSDPVSAKEAVRQILGAKINADIVFVEGDL